jgi:hypothetical protein
MVFLVHGWAFSRNRQRSPDFIAKDICAAAAFVAHARPSESWRSDNRSDERWICGISPRRCASVQLHSWCTHGEFRAVRDHAETKAYADNCLGYCRGPSQVHFVIGVVPAEQFTAGSSVLFWSHRRFAVSPKLYQRPFEAH